MKITRTHKSLKIKVQVFMCNFDVRDSPEWTETELTIIGDNKNDLFAFINEEVGVETEYPHNIGFDQYYTLHEDDLQNWANEQIHQYD